MAHDADRYPAAVAGFFALVTGGNAVARRPPPASMPVSWRGVSITAAFLLLMFAVHVTLLGRFDRLFDDHTIFAGVTYTDAHVTLTGLLVVAVALVLAR